MKVYHNLAVRDEDLPEGTKAVPFRIEAAKLLKRVYGGQVALGLELNEVGEEAGLSCGYGLIGSDFIRQFAKDAGINRVSDLVGKEIVGYVPVERDTLRGISIKREKESPLATIPDWSGWSDSDEGDRSPSPRISHAEDGDHNRGCVGSWGYGPASHNLD